MRKLLYRIFLNRETRDMINCMSSPPPFWLARATSKAIRKMKRKGLWQKLDNWYVFDGPDEEWARLNWVDPKPGDTAFTNKTVQDDGVDDYIDTDWDPRAVIQEPPFPDED